MALGLLLMMPVIAMAIPQMWTGLTTQHVYSNSTCPSSAGNCSAAQMDIVSGLGEKENRLLAVRFVTDTTLNITALGVPPGVTVRFSKVIGVYCNQSTLYSAVGDRYVPDILVPWEQLGLNPVLSGNITHVLWVQVSVDSTAQPGNYNCSIQLIIETIDGINLLAEVPVKLKVMNLLIPSLVAAKFETIFNFYYRSDQDGATNISAYYGLPNITSTLKADYFHFLCDARVPPDDPYIINTRPLEDYIIMDKCGAQSFNLLNVDGFLGRGLLNYTDQQLKKLHSALDPLVNSLRGAGLLDKAYVYGFDEQSVQYVPAIWCVCVS